ncbi:MAG: hemolysin III family protein [Oscillospiraceae bacterium]|nr:hemolysin III family protein [Oscillospiraceae bacterium]
MTRTKLADRELPDYTRGEEIFNMVSHIVGGAFAIAALVLCLVFSHDGWGIAGSLAFGISLILQYCMSSIYHGLYPNMGKKVMQVLDHCTIYFLIAGTYTPVLLCAVRPLDAKTAWILFAVVWGCAAVATVFTAIDLEKYNVMSMICYIGMGWCIIVAVKTVIAAIGRTGFWLLLAGGIAYTVGAVLYGIGSRVRYMHSVFHLFVLAGSFLHFLCILLYVL